MCANFLKYTHTPLIDLFRRYEATDMNIYRSALSACVIMGLPNVYDYIHKHRERLMEEKRQKILLSETARHGQHRTALPDVSTYLFHSPMHALHHANRKTLQLKEKPPAQLIFYDYYLVTGTINLLISLKSRSNLINCARHQIIIGLT